MIRERGQKLLRKVLSLPGVQTVLDAGVGPGLQAVQFVEAGKTVIGLDTRTRPAHRLAKLPNYTHILGDVEQFTLPEPVDLVWCNHVLEHLRNPGLALQALRRAVKYGGWLAICVPSDDDSREKLHIGHLTYWSPLMLLYHVVVNGTDCKDAQWYHDEKGDVGLLVQINGPPVDWGFTGTKDDRLWINEAMPISVSPGEPAWLEDRWDEEGVVSSPG